MGQECLPVCVNLPKSHKGTVSVISQQYIFNASRTQRFNDDFYIPLNLLHYDKFTAGCFNKIGLRLDV